jgi:hypothetical protein
MPLYINGLAWSAGLPALEAYPPQVFRWFTAAVALMAVVLPLLSLLWMKRVGMISSLEVPEAGQRRSPYTVQALCLGGLWWMLADLNLSPWLTRPLLSSLVLVLWALVWLERTKVSAHAMGMGALTAATACLYRQGADWGWEASAVGGWSPSGWSPSAFLVPAAVLLSGLVVAGRLRSGAHTPAELLHGWGAGLLAMGLGLWGLGPTD